MALFFDESFETFRPFSSDSPPPTRSHLLIFPKQFSWLRIKHSNKCTYGIIYIQTTTMHLLREIIYQLKYFDFEVMSIL